MDSIDVDFALEEDGGVPAVGVPGVASKVELPGSGRPSSPAGAVPFSPSRCMRDATTVEGPASRAGRAPDSNVQLAACVPALVSTGHAVRPPPPASGPSGPLCLGVPFNLAMASGAYLPTGVQVDGDLEEGEAMESGSLVLGVGRGAGISELQGVRLPEPQDEPGKGSSVSVMAKPFRCTSCSYRCSSKSHLAAHQVTHTDEKPFACVYCPFRSKRPHGMKSHERTHTGEKPFVCSYCPFRSSRSFVVRRHERTHTGERPFAAPTAPDVSVCPVG